MFSSSSLCSSLAARLLRRPNASARPLALLAVHAAARDARHLAPDHPALQLIAARAAEVACPVREEGSVWPKGKAEVMEELLKLKDSLPVEGSPHGEAHGQQSLGESKAGAPMDSAYEVTAFTSLFLAYHEICRIFFVELLLLKSTAP